MLERRRFPLSLVLWLESTWRDCLEANVLRLCVFMCMGCLNCEDLVLLLWIYYPPPPPSCPQQRCIFFPLSFHGSVVTGDLEGHFIDVCMSWSFRGEVRGKDSGSYALERGCTKYISAKYALTYCSTGGQIMRARNERLRRDTVPCWSPWNVLKWRLMIQRLIRNTWAPFV